MTYSSTATRAITATIGVATSHAGEILQGALRDGGRTRRLLLSLPAPALWTQAEIRPTPGHSLKVEPVWAARAGQAARRLLTQLGLRIPDVTVRLTTNIPVGKGCGSSTADILATVRALLVYTGTYLNEEDIARLIVSVERASDSTVLSRPALFRHREGAVEEYLPGGFPEASVLVIDTEPAATINTVSLARASYSDAQLAHFMFLVGELRQAFRDRDPRRLGAVATASARVSQLFLPKPDFEKLTDLVACEGGYGIATSHSGTVVSALLPVHSRPEAVARLRKAIQRFGMRVVTQYSLRSSQAAAA